MLRGMSALQKMRSCDAFRVAFGTHDGHAAPAEKNSHRSRLHHSRGAMDRQGEWLLLALTTLVGREKASGSPLFILRENEKARGSPLAWWASASVALW